MTLCTSGTLKNLFSGQASIPVERMLFQFRFAVLICLACTCLRSYFTWWRRTTFAAMKILKTIFYKLVAAWAAIVFVLLILLVVLPTWFGSLLHKKQRGWYYQRLHQAWIGTFFVLTGIRRVYKGRHYFTGKENFVVVANHTSFVDVLLCSPGIPEPNKTIAKIEMASIPVFGIIYRSCSVLVDRKSGRSRAVSYIKMKEVLAEGMHMCIYPEGTRNTTTEPLLRFQDGAFKLAIDTHKRIIPAVILNTRNVMPAKKKFYFEPHKIEMHFLQPVEVAGKTPETLKHEVYEIMEQYLVSKGDFSKRTTPASAELV